MSAKKGRPTRTKHRRKPARMIISKGKLVIFLWTQQNTERLWDDFSLIRL